MAKSAEERLDELQEKKEAAEKKLKQLQMQEKDLMKKRNAEARKARTRRLIILGGAIEAAMKRPVSEDEIEEIAAVTAAAVKYGSPKELGFAAVIEEVLGRKVNAEDVHRVRLFLEYQEERGSYFSSWMDGKSSRT